MLASLIITLFISFILVYFVNVFGTKSVAKQDITLDKLLSITVGMSEVQVIQILGDPLLRTNFKDGYQLTYTEPVKLSRFYPMLWIAFNHDREVHNVSVKRRDGLIDLDDFYIYNLRDQYDSISKEWTPYIHDFWIKRCFKNRY
jgi:hypothetical protein